MEDKNVKADCECADSGCPVHESMEFCGREASVTVFRIDMEDETGTAMCEGCAEDALDAGIFYAEDAEDDAS